ncbi:MAG TPA: GNAT family N-acetyltransferase, partial [Leptospiraceae bacterium]|nr:GNAT family N-acetyltransferase [Leptospiraceae bacterium]
MPEYRLAINGAVLEWFVGRKREQPCGPAEHREYQMYHAFLKGERIYLRGLEDTDVDSNYFQWLNDQEVCRGNSHGLFPIRRSDLARYVSQAGEYRANLVLAIIVSASETHIGNIALQNIDWVSRSAEFAILVGEKEFWGKGYGLEAGRMIIEHGFKALNLHRIY